MRIILVGIIFVLLFASSAPAAPTVDGTFNLSGSPGLMTRDNNNNIWLALSMSSANKEFARITPDGTVTEFDTPNNLDVIGIGIGPKAVGGADDQIWLSQTGAVTRFDPAANSGQTFTVAVLNGPRSIVADKEGYIWVVDDSDGLVRLDPNNGNLLNEVKVAGSSGRGLTLGSDGNLYWADFAQGAINKTLSASPFTTTSFAVGGGPQEVAAGPEGQIAYSNPGANPQEVGTISLDGVVEKTQAPLTDPFGVSYASDGNYYFANFASADLASLTSAAIYSKSIAIGNGPRYLVAGAPGTVWVGQQANNKVTRVSGISVPQPDPGKANFTKLTASPKVKKIARGKRFKLTVTLTNSGTAPGTATVKLKANSRLKLIKSFSATVAAGQTISRKITVRARRSGKATISISIDSLKANSRVTVRR